MLFLLLKHFHCTLRSLSGVAGCGLLNHGHGCTRDGAVRHELVKWHQWRRWQGPGALIHRPGGRNAWRAYQKFSCLELNTVMEKEKEKKNAYIISHSSVVLGKNQVLCNVKKRHFAPHKKFPPLLSLFREWTQPALTPHSQTSLIVFNPPCQGAVLKLHTHACAFWPWCIPKHISCFHSPRKSYS